MTIDMTNNRVPCGLLTDEEKAALHEHEKAGGKFLFTCGGDQDWEPLSSPNWLDNIIYRTVPLPKTKDVIAWEKLPDWVEWVARDMDEEIYARQAEPELEYEHWQGTAGMYRRIDDFPGILVQIGTCDWKDSKQRRPRG
jgi:hypothetical protein